MNSSKHKRIYLVEAVIIFVYFCTLVFFHFHASYIANYDALKFSFFYLIIAIVLVNLYLHFKTLNTEAKSAWLVVIAVTLLSSLPLFFKGINYDGHDIAFHIYRIEGIVHEIKTGHFPTRIYSMWNNGYGYPAPIYYGDILLYFPAALRILGFSTTVAYKVFIFSINLFTAILSFVCFGKMFDDHHIAYATTFAFCLTPYRLTDIYARHAVGEYCAMLFFPVVILAFWLIYQDSNTGIKKNFYNGLLLALGMTGIVLTHVLSTEMVSFTLFLFFLILYKKSFHSNVIASFAIAVIITMLLSASFLIPFLDYFFNVQIMTSVSVSNGLKIQNDGISIAELFTFFSADPDSNVQLTPGLYLFIDLVLAIAIIIKDSSTKIIRILLVTSALFLIMSTNIFPWDIISNIRGVNILTQVQFPWRYIGIACTIMTILLGFLLKEKSLAGKLLNYNIALSILSALIFVSLFAFNPSISYYEVQDNFFAPGRREYARILFTDNGRIETDYEKYSGEILGNFEAANILENDGLDMTIYIKNGPESAEVVLPRTNYPGYKVTDDNHTNYSIYDSDNLTVAFMLPANFEGNIYLTYETPWYWSASIVVSLVAYLLTLVYFTAHLRSRHTSQT